MKFVLIIFLSQSFFSLQFSQKDCRIVKDDSIKLPETELNKGGFFMIKRPTSISTRSKQSGEYYFAEVKSKIPILQIDVLAINTANFLGTSDAVFWKSLATCFKTEFTDLARVTGMIRTYANFWRNLSLPDSLNIFSAKINNQKHYFIMFTESVEKSSFLRTIILVIEENSIDLLYQFQLRFPVWEDAFTFVDFSTEETTPIPSMDFTKAEIPDQSGHKLTLTFNSIGKKQVTIEIPDEAKFGSEMPMIKVEWPLTWPQGVEAKIGFDLTSEYPCLLYTKLDAVYNLREKFTKKDKTLNCNREARTFSKTVQGIEEIYIFLHFDKNII